MEITKELGPMLDAEGRYIEEIKSELAKFNDSLTEKAEHDLRMGFRTKALVDIRLKRHRAIRQPKCDECGTELHRFATDELSGWSCDTCGFSWDV